MKFTEGVFPNEDITAYHADKSLSASVGKPLVPGRSFSTTPLHVWHSSPLNPKYEPENRKTFDKGNAMHEMVLGRGRGLKVIDAENFMTKAAKEARDEAYALGLTPVLIGAYAELEEAKKVADRLLEQAPWGHPFRDGQAEVALRWIERTKWGDVQCKALVDWLPNKLPLERGIDYKSTGQSANPEWWTKRQMNNLGYDISAAFHRRGYKALGLAHSCDYLWVVQEWDAPYACSIVGYSDEELNDTEVEIQQMIETWAKCIKTNEWPGYMMDPYMAKRPRWLKNEVRLDDGDHLSSEDIARGL